MLELPGSPALSAFRIAKLLERLQALEPAVARAAGAASCISSSSPRRSRRSEQAVLEQLLDLRAASAGRGRRRGRHRERAAGGAARRHDLALVEQGHRHRAGVRAAPRAAHRARHRATRSRCGASAAARPALARLAPPLHDRMTEAVLRGRGAAARAVRAAAAAAAAPRVTRPAAARRCSSGQPAAGSGAVRGRDRLPARELSRARARSDRRRADDVRAGEFRALPPQDLQRQLDHRRRAQRADSLFAMIRNTHARSPAGRAVGLSRQCRGHRGHERRALVPRSGDRHLPRAATSRSTS